VASFPGGHPRHRHGKRRLQEHRQIPHAGQLVAVQEQTVDDEDGSWRGRLDRRVELLIADQVVAGRLKAA
jgi:hypothetical protein